MKGIKRIVATVVCGALLCSTVAFSACSGNSAANGQRYMVTYELNYDGAGAREMSVTKGAKAKQWRAYRDGYELEGWYTDSACTQPYNFTKGITGDCTLYANWTVKKGYVELTYDYDYIGRVNKTVSVKPNQTIPEKAIPLVDDRIGMKFEGWYKDKEKTQKCDMETYVIKDDTTLYANYEIDPGWVIRNPNGTVKYDNVQIEVCYRGDGKYAAGDYDVFKQLVDEFNAAHAGEITAKAAMFDWDNDNNSFLIMDRTLSMEANRYYWSYYDNAADILTVAGVELDMSAFYENGIRDVFVDGTMLGYPIAAQTPYLLYSKALMNKYWGCIGNKLPTNYTEFTKLMRAAYAGESGTNSNFKSILQWGGDFNYLPCTIPFVQNGAEFYRVEGDKRVCDWEDSAIAAKAKTALTNYYDVFGANGTCHGTAYGSNRLANLNSNNALFAVMGLSSGENEKLVVDAMAQSGNIGVMSMAGLFSDDAENANKVPILPVSVGFWKGAVAVTPTQKCASAEFAKFLAENADRFADYGLVPLKKSAYAKFEQKTSANAQILQTAITPDNFYTCDGSIRDWFVRRDVVSPSLLTYLKGDGTNTEDVFQQLFSGIKGKIG